MSPADRALIEDLLLQDPTRSCRSISRQTGYSDWTIRKIARELDGDPRPMKQQRWPAHETPREPESVSPVTSWLTFGGFIAVLALMIWAGMRWAPPLDSPDFFHSFHPNPPTERTDDET